MIIAKSNVMVKFISGFKQLDEALVPHSFDTLTVLLAVRLVELLGRDRFVGDSLNLLYKMPALPFKSRID